MELNSFVILLQGNIRIDPSIIEKSWEGYNIIWSTWKGETLDSKNEILFNDYPQDYGTGNLGLQRVSTYNALLHAKALGFKRAIKWRSDQYPTNPEALLQLMKADAINVLYWHQSGKYYVDYFMEGDIDSLLKVWDFNEYSNYPYAEYKVTDQIIKSKANVNCIGDFLNEKNDIVWENSRIYIKLSTLEKDPAFEALNIVNNE